MKSQSLSQGTISFATAITLGESIDSYGVGSVLFSHRPEFKKGYLVVGLLTWGEYSIVKECSLLNKLDPNMGFPLSYHVGVFEFRGPTAYGEFVEVCKSKPRENVFVSAASNLIGHLAGQYAKLHGCYVVGYAGSQEKVKFLTERLGYDDVFNYKQQIDLKSALKSPMLATAVASMNLFGRVAVCGVISEYTNSSTRDASEMLDILIYEYDAKFLSKTVEYLLGRKLKTIEYVSRGIESIPSAFIGLFNDKNIGKKIVKVIDD
ncbi:hypothetical protein R3W88_024648 [Solanum pinnatisectum]|uniref:Alcohol dehydrogenase-like C-terminal domain-containing protein n=1 Tax=Solanum pinnatisectum TaxID=50273 RepID=A0AAV9M447_9SOLN|nr:hypothetical protein R3W88_024648 [Solanum pinnatisectum]